LGLHVSQPIVIMGRRLKDMKGHFFSLLDERETEQVRSSAFKGRYSVPAHWSSAVHTFAVMSE
jgi:hypothetical protein